MSTDARKPFQHHFNELGESQLSACFHQATWSITKITADYGQDFLLHPFQYGELTGREGYIQLKSTDNVTKYAHSQGYRYRVKKVHLRQWHRLLWPVFLILWDITHERGFWVHVQPLITMSLAEHPHWLEGTGTHTLHIPATQIVHRGELGGLPAALDAAYQRLTGHIDHEQQQQLARPDVHLARADPPPDPLASQRSHPLPPSAQQLLVIARLQAAAEQSPQEWRIDLALATVHYERHSLTEALHAIHHAQAKGASGDRYLLMRASILTEYANAQTPPPRHLLVEAERIFATLGDHLTYPDKVHNDYNHGNVYKALCQYEKAIACYDSALEHHPDASLAGKILTNKGACLFQLGRHEEEYRAYAEAVQCDPARWQALSCWAATEVRRGQPGHAQQLLLQAVAVAPAIQQLPSETYALAYASYQLADYPAAARWAQQTVHLLPAHQRALRLLVLSLSHLWRRDGTYGEAAINAYQQWLANEPGDLFVVKELYLVYRARGAHDSARALVGDTHLAHDATAASLFYYGSMLADEGQGKAAMDVLEQAQAASPEPYIVHQLGHVYQQQGWYRKAITCYAHLLPDYEVSHLTAIADCFACLHEYAPCIPLALRILTLQPHNERLWHNLQSALWICGERSASLYVQRLLIDDHARGLTDDMFAGGVATLAAMLSDQHAAERRGRPWTRDDIPLANVNAAESV